MNVVVTGGATIAPLDDVRLMTNVSSGHFAAAITEACIARQARVWHIHARSAELPFFRFPYGAKTPAEQGFVEHRGNTTFFWNMDSQDWRIRDPHKLFLNVLAELDRAKHGIILFHDIHEQTVIVLPHVLAELRARGMTPVVFVAAPLPASAPHGDPSWDHRAPLLP